ncbi:putative signal transducing protein [Rhodoflexus sp.]
MNWQKIYSAANPAQAEMIKILLQENDIQAILLNKRDSVYNMFGEAEVHVLREDVIKAIQLIKHELETERFD